MAKNEQSASVQVSAAVDPIAAGEYQSGKDRLARIGGEAVAWYKEWARKIDAAGACYVDLDKPRRQLLPGALKRLAEKFGEHFQPSYFSSAFGALVADPVAFDAITTIRGFSEVSRKGKTAVVPTEADSQKRASSALASAVKNASPRILATVAPSIIGTAVAAMTDAELLATVKTLAVAGIGRGIGKAIGAQINLAIAEHAALTAVSAPVAPEVSAPVLSPVA